MLQQLVESQSYLDEANKWLILERYAQGLQKLRNYQEAKKYYELVLDKKKIQYKYEQKRWISTLANLANINYELKNFNESLELNLECIRIHQENQSKDTSD